MRSWSKSCMQRCLKRMTGWRGAGHIPTIGEDEQEAAPVLYLAATRATQRLRDATGMQQPMAAA